MLRSSLPGIGLSAAVVAVSLAIYGATQDGGRGPAPNAVGPASADVTLPPPLAASGPFGVQPVAGVRGGDDDAPVPSGAGGVFVPVVFDPPATLPAAPRTLGGGQRREGGNRRADRPDRRPGKRGSQRGGGAHGGNENAETVRPTARPATPAPQQPSRPQRPDPPKRPVDLPVNAGNPRAPGLLRKAGQLPPGQAKQQAASAPAPVAPAPAPAAPAKPQKPVVPPGQAAKQAPAPAAPPAARPAPAPAAPPASGCAPAGNGHGNANGRC